MKLSFVVFAAFLSVATGFSGTGSLSGHQERPAPGVSDLATRHEGRTGEVHPRAENQAIRVVSREGSYDCYVVDSKRSDLQFYWKDQAGQPIRSLKNLAQITANEQKTLIFATNAGMYTPDNAPQGLFIQHGKLAAPLDREKGKPGNFYLQPNGVFLVDTAGQVRVVTTEAYLDSMPGSVKFATQSGPMVVINGAINPVFKINSANLNIRSGVGIVDSIHAVFVISNQPVNFYDFARVFQEKFHCPNALYLDGAISEMYLPELGRLQEGGNFGPIIGITKNQ